MGFLDKIKEATSKATAKLKCETCGSMLSMWENATGIHKCAKCALPELGMREDDSERSIFSQIANYRDGIADHPQQSKKNGYLYVCDDNLYFIDLNISWKARWENIKHADLDLFKPGTGQAMLAGLNATVLRQIRSALAITGVDDDGTEWTVRWNIHGAVTAHGDQDKATELLSHINKFRSRFAKAKDTQSAEDIAAKIQKLIAMKDQGLVTDDEFQSKKAELLARM